jgi:hypothetical protein
LGGKEPTITSGTTSQYWRGDKSWQTLDKSAVGLSDVENTAISTWTGSSNITTVGTLTNLTVTNTITGSVSGNSATVTNGVYTTGSYADPSWITSLSKSKVGLSNVEDTALSTWAGSSSITTLGTIASGTWNGSTIGATYIDSAIARLSGPTFTGTVVLPSTTSIGDVSSTELGHLDGVTSAIQTQLNAKANISISTNAQTGTSYTLVLSDASKLIEMNNASANTLTIPTDSSVAFPVGTKIDIVQTGAGETSIAPASGVTLNSDGNKRKVNVQWAGVSLIKRGTDTWVLIGSLKA